MTLCGRLGTLIALALSFGCASDDPVARARTVVTMGVEQYRPPARYRLPTTSDTYEILQYVNDPIEPLNRGSFVVGKGVADYGIRPAAIGWRAAFPKSARVGIDNFAYNLDYPGRFVSLLLQGQLARAGSETANFVVNSTVGVVGLIDVARRLGIPTYDEDIGQAFGTWGIGPGFYLFIPLLGPSSGRDALGKVFDLALSPTVWVQTHGIAWGVFTLNAFSSRIDTYDRLNEGGIDLYLPVRTLWAIERDIAVTDYVIPTSAYETAQPAPSLAVMLTRLDDEGFARRDAPGKARSAVTGRQLPYSLWLQDEPAPLLFIVPGIGSHRSETSALKLAESAFERGYSAVTISSPFNPEFIDFGLSSLYAGHTPNDAADVYRALGEIRADLELRHPGRVTSSSLMGYSLGGIVALFVSQLERNTGEPGALHFERVVAINPAVNLRYAVGRFDEYFETPLAWPQDQRRARAIEVAKKAYVISQGSADLDIEKYQTLPFQLDESRFLLGLSSRATALQAISASHKRGGEELAVIPGSAGGFYGVLAGEVASNTLTRYMNELAIPHFVEREGGVKTADELFASANLYSQEAGLRDDPRIHVFTNADDFLLSESDLAWLRKLFAGRITVFPGGGHLGNMYMQPVQAAFVDALGAPAAEQTTKARSEP